MEEIRPPLKWLGGKNWLVPKLQTLWAPHIHHRLVDMFVGGGSVPFGLRSTTALIADLNTHLMNFYRWVQAGMFVSEKLENTEEAYYRNRERFNFLILNGWEWEQETAILFYYLNKTCFNGLCRFNGRGEFNTAYGKYKKVNYVIDWFPHSIRMEKWELARSSFLYLPTLPDDFVYADPPYDGVYDGYNAEGFAWEDHIALAQKLAAHPGPSVASNAYNKRTAELYGDLGFYVENIQGPRFVSCNGDRTPVWEILASKNIR